MEIADMKATELTIDPEFIKYIEQYRIQNNLKQSEMKILDWGCGTGQTVAWLRTKGYNCYGVDIDPERIENAKLFLKSLDIYKDDILTLVAENGRTIFPNNYFHFIFSRTVLEHVKDIALVASEISRITRQQGRGFHVYPAHRGLIEKHILMPFVHWLPKNRLLKIVILIWVLLGIEPPWEKLKQKTRIERANVLFDYIVNNTYYRDYHTVQKAFEQWGNKVEFVSVEHYKVKQMSSIIASLTQKEVFRGMLNWCLINFRAVCLLTNKIGNV